MNFAIIILTILGILSDLVEFTYEAGSFTRKYIIPAIVMGYVVTEYYSKKAYDYLISMEMEIDMHVPVPGFAYK